MSGPPRRKRPRLKGYDYSRAGGYFVTICTKHKQHSLSQVVGRGLAPAEIQLLPAGQIVAEELELLPQRFPGVFLEHSVIMPNHIHLLLRLTAAGASPRPTLADVVRALKSLTTRRWNAHTGICGQQLWQPSYHDHIIRDESDFLRRWSYIESNPARWAEDEYYDNCEE